MLCRYDKFVESGIFNGAYQCICIKILCQRKYLIWCAVSIMLAPLNLVECVWTKVTKRCQLFLLIIILVFIRQYVIRRGLCCGIILEFAVSDPLANVDTVIAAAIKNAKLLAVFLFTLLPLLES